MRLNTSESPMDQILQNLLHETKSSFVKSWFNIQNQKSLHLFYNHETLSFSAVIKTLQDCQFIPSTKDGFELIKVPFLDSQTTRDKLSHFQPSQLLDFFRRELRYPLIKETENNDICNIQLNIGGLLGGGGKVSKVHNSKKTAKQQEEPNFKKDSNEYKMIFAFLKKRYRIDYSKTENPITKDANNAQSQIKDKELVEGLTMKICHVLPNDQSSRLEKYLSKSIDAYEELFFDQVVLETLGKKIEEGKPTLADYTQRFASRKLCLELLRKGYFAKERARGGIGLIVSERILARLAEETRPFFSKSDKNVRKEGESFNDLLLKLEMKEQVKALLKPLTKVKAKSVMESITMELGLKLDQVQDFDEFNFALVSKEKFHSLKTGNFEAFKSRSASLPESGHNRVLSVPPSVGIKPNEKITSEADDVGGKSKYLDKIRLNVLSEMNLLDHDPNTLVELHNLLDLDAEQSVLGQKKQNNNPSHSKLDDIKNLLRSLITGYHENESHLEPKDLESLIPLAFVYDRDIFRRFLEAFLEDFRNDILFSPHKVKMLSFILMSTLRDKKLKGYIVPDDLLSIFKTMKPKLESLSITSGNINLQEALNSLNDVLFLMGFIEAKGVRESDFNAVLELLTNMQTHMLEKVFNTVRSASKDPSLEIKREYAIESLKRIGGTEYAEWQDKLTSCIEIGQIAVDIGKGIFLGDLSSLSEALLQAGGLVAGYLNNLPKNWFDAANRFRFLSQESIRKIIVEIFSNQKFSNRYVSFYAAELLLLVLAQPNRQLLEKKIAIQALWFLAHGYDILLSNSLEILVKSRVHKHDKDIHHYIKEALKNIASNSNTELNFFILNLLETPLKVEILSRDKADVWNEILNYQSKKEQKQEGGNGVPFFMKVLMEKKPKLYALARIQKRSEKTLAKPALLIEFRGIDREKDFDDAFKSKIKEKVENITNEEILKNLASIKKVKQYLDLENATKKSLFDLFDNPKRYHIGDKNKEKTEQKEEEEENENQQENKEKESQNPTAREEGAAKEEGDDKEGVNQEEGKVKEEQSKEEEYGKRGKKQEGEELDEENETERRGNDENKKPENVAKAQEEDNAQKKEKEKKEKALKNARDKVIKKVNNKIIPEIVKKGRANLFETLEDFLNDPTKSVLLIQGEAGTGKTLLLGLIEEKLWKRYNILTKANMKNPNRLPLRIILSEVRTFETAVEEFLHNYGCGYDEIQEIKKEPAVILFDGYDEINQTINLYDKNKLEMWRDVKVIFTSRKENLTSLKEDYITCFAPNKDRNKVLSHSILTIDRDQIKKYFSGQINENLEKIEKLEKELGEKNGNGERIMPVTANLKRKIEYLQKFFETDRYESSLDILTALEERIPKMEKVEIGEAGNETDGIRSELIEIFKKRVVELKRFTDSKNIEAFKEEIKKNQSVTEKLETDLDLLNTAIGSYGALAVQKSGKKIKVLTSLKEILQEISGNFDLIEKKISKLNRHLKKHSSCLTTAKDALESIKDKATSTYFKKLFERLVEKMEEIKKTEKQIKSTGASCTTYLSKELALLDEQTYIGQLEKTIQGLSTLLEQLNTVHKSVEWLYLEDEDEVEQQPQQPTQDKNSTKEDRRSFDKLQKPISTLQTLLKSFKESAKEMKVFDKDFINHEKLRRGLENLLYDSGFDPEQSMIDAISDSYWEFKNITGEIAAFRKEGKRSDDMTVPVIEFIKELLELIHLESVQFTFKKLEEQIKQAQQTIKTKGNRIGKANIDKIEELHKRLKDIENSDETEYMDQIQIQDLNEMVEEILELEKESKTIKDRDNVELPLRIKAIGEEMLTLEKFTDPKELDSIIENFEDIVSPFMLKMLLDTLIQVPKSASNKADLYELFSKIHFEREKDKLIMNEKIPPKFNIIASFYHFSKDLAVNMFIKKVTSIQAKSNGYKVLGGSGAMRKNVWNRFFDDKDVITRLSRRGAQIIEDDGMVRFIHKSVMEYFAAKQFYDEIAEYDADNQEIYDPWLNMGPLVDNETAVYRFINDIADSKERAERSHEKEKARIKNNGDNDDYDEDDKEKEKEKDNAHDQKNGESEGKDINEQPKSQNEIANSQVVEKNSSSKERIIFDKKIVEIFTSIPLQKEYGGDLDQKHFYSNLFLLLLSRKGLVKRLLEEKEEIVPLSAINNIFEWIFSRSEASWKFVETIGTMGDYIPNGYKSFWPLLLEYYHFKTNPINKSTNLVNKSTQNEVFLESHSQHPIRLIPPKPKGEVIGSFIPNKNRDGVVDDEKETPSFKWEMDAKLFLHGSQESVVVLKASGFNNHRYFSLDTKQTASENPFTLIDTKTPWEIKECKWMLQLNFPDKLMFKLRSLADSSQILCGTFKEAKDYEWFFPEMCTCDVHGGSVCDAVYICSTCETENPELKGYIYCKNCKEACHKKHNIVLYNETGKTGGYCDCRFVGTCKIAVGCTSRFNKKYNKDTVMWKCNQCPDEKKNIVFCTGCKKHHDQTHVNFEKVTGCQECKCDCVSNRIKILPTRKLEYFDKDDDKIELSEDTWADDVNVYVASDDEDDDKEDENKEEDDDEDEDGDNDDGDDDDGDGDGEGDDDDDDDDDDDNGEEDEDEDDDDGNDDDEDEEEEEENDDDDNEDEDEENDDD